MTKRTELRQINPPLELREAIMHVPPDENRRKPNIALTDEEIPLEVIAWMHGVETE